MRDNRKGSSEEYDSFPKFYIERSEKPKGEMSESGMLVRIGKAGQVRLPTALLKDAGIKEGDLLAVRLEGGLIILKPGGLTEGSQSYFWTEEWQQAEREADKDIEEGRVVKADTIEGLIDELGQDSS